MPRTPATTTHVSRKELVAYANYMDSYLGDLRAAIAVMDREKLDDIYVIAWQSAVDCLARAKAFRSRLSEALYAIEMGTPHDEDTLAPRSRLQPKAKDKVKPKPKRKSKS